MAMLVHGDNTSSVTDMHSMFYKASSFNADINARNTSLVTTMSRMFFIMYNIYYV